jgi:hypothetical protein
MRMTQPYHSDRELRAPRALAGEPPLEPVRLKPGLLERLLHYRKPRSEPIGYRKHKPRT